MGQPIGLTRTVRVLAHGCAELLHGGGSLLQGAGLALGARRQVAAAAGDLCAAAGDALRAVSHHAHHHLQGTLHMGHARHHTLRRKVRYLNGSGEVTLCDRVGDGQHLCRFPTQLPVQRPDHEKAQRDGDDQTDNDGGDANRTDPLEVGHAGGVFGPGNVILNLVQAFQGVHGGAHESHHLVVVNLRGLFHVATCAGFAQGFQAHGRQIAVSRCKTFGQQRLFRGEVGRLVGLPGLGDLV